MRPEPDEPMSTEPKSSQKPAGTAGGDINPTPSQPADDEKK